MDKPPRSFTPTVDLELVRQAQAAAQLSLSLLAQAQGYEGDGTFGQLVDAWLAAKTSSCTASTVAGYEDNARALALELARARHGDLPRPRLAELGRAISLRELEVGEVEAAIDRLPQGRWNSVTSSTRALVRWGNRHGFPGLLPLLPALRKHKAAPVRHRAAVWSRAAHLLHEAFLSADRRSVPTAAASLCAVLWGVRRSAVARIEWAAVDLEARQVLVRGDKGRTRIVVLGELETGILGELWQRHPEGPGPKSFVFPARDNEHGHVHPNSLTAHTRRVLRPAGLPLTLHQAGRHAAGGAILDLGGSEEDAAAHLGHKTTRMVRERYVALPDGTRGRELLDEAFRKGGA